MPIVHMTTIPVELNDGIKRLRELNPIGLADNSADLFSAALTQGGQALSLSGATVMGYFIRADGQTVYLTGSVNGSAVSVTLTAACYAVAGPFTLSLKVETSEDNLGTVLIIDGTVVRTQTSEVADYGDEYPSLEALLAMLDGKVNEPDAEGSAGQVLGTDGNGGRFWTNAAASGPATQLQIGSNVYTLREGTSGAAGYITIETE